MLPPQPQQRLPLPCVPAPPRQGTRPIGPSSRAPARPAHPDALAHTPSGTRPPEAQVPVPLFSVHTHAQHHHVCACAQTASTTHGVPSHSTYTRHTARVSVHAYQRRFGNKAFGGSQGPQLDCKARVARGPCANFPITIRPQYRLRSPPPHAHREREREIHRPPHGYSKKDRTHSPRRCWLRRTRLAASISMTLLRLMPTVMARGMLGSYTC
jgi:hypothetical protein